MTYHHPLRNRAFLVAIIAAIAATLCACSLSPKKPSQPDAVDIEKASFQALPGWKTSEQSGALLAFKKSCGKLKLGVSHTERLQNHPALSLADLRQACEQALKWQGNAREFFEANFDVYAASFNHARDSFFTGYYEPELKASRIQNGRFNTPIYALPDDLVTVNLGDFNNGWQGQKLWGRVDGKQLKPYWTRAEIHHHNIPAEVIAWANAIDVFFLQIQGSGLLALAGGEMMRVGFAGRNGHPYTAIGKPLIEQGELEAATMSMQNIRTWLTNNPERAQSIMNLNASYIFFRPLADSRTNIESSGPVGAHGVPLTARHSIAVDPEYWQYGLPLYISAQHPDDTQPMLNQLLITQDTGSAIKGPLRGDVFWGNGKYATEMAGKMKSQGVTWVLLPKKP